MQNIPRRPMPASSLVAAAACLSAAACMTGSPPKDELAPERLAQLRQICADTMQLSPGNAHFEDCVAVLGEAARKQERGRSRP